MELTGFAKTLAEHEMRTVEDAREQYRFSIRSCRRRADDVGALPAEHALVAGRSAIEYLEDNLRRHDVVDVAIPMRRLVQSNSAARWNRR